MLDENVYALGRDLAGEGKLFQYSILNNEWKVIPVPSEVFATNSVLIAYCSKLLLISGETMKIWEFSHSQLDFKLSLIEPVPSGETCFQDFYVTSKEKCLIVTLIPADWEVILSETKMARSKEIVHVIFDGRMWRLKSVRYNILCSGPHMHRIRNKSGVTEISNISVFSDSTMFLFVAGFDFIHNEPESLRIYKTTLLLDKLTTNDALPAHCNWIECDVIYFPKFFSLLNTPKFLHFILFHNHQLYFTDLNGAIFTIFDQSLIIPMLLVDSGCHFKTCPHIIALSDETMLMIGVIEEEQGAQLDVIGITEKGESN